MDRNQKEKLLIYKNVPQNVFWDDNELVLPEKAFEYLHFFKNTQWKIIDFDGDGISDLLGAVISLRSPDLRSAGSVERKKAFLRAPKHNQLIFLRNKGNNNQGRHKHKPCSCGR